MSMLNDIARQFASTPQFDRVLRRSGSPTYVRNVAGSLLAFLTAHLYARTKAQVLLVVPDDDAAEKARDDCAQLAGDEAVRLLGHKSGHQARQLDMSSPIARIETLNALADHRRVIVVASAPALAAPVPSPQVLGGRTIDIAAGREEPFEPLLARLAAMGFERKEFVEEYGDFAVRGGILDVFPFVGENPVRVEFWGDTVESIREFDVLSQRSIRNLGTARIVADLDRVDEENTAGGMAGERSLGSFFSYLSSDAIVVIDEPAHCSAELEELRAEGVEGFASWDEIRHAAAAFATIVHSSVDAPPDAIDVGASLQPAINGSVRMLASVLRELHRDGFDTTICCDTKQGVDRLKELLEEEVTAPERSPIRAAGPDEGDDAEADELTTGPDDGDATEEVLPVTVLGPESPGARTFVPSARFSTEALHSGFLYPSARVALLTEHEIFGRLKRRGGGRKTRFKGFSAKELAQLKRGDYVVHVDYGVGRFAGLQKIRVRGVEQEVMKVVYEGDDSIYVNLAYINRVQKYSAQEGHVPRLAKLGSPDWERLKNRARKKVKDIARDLIKLYARRKAEEGLAFAPDTHWQKEMEASFQYEDTPDQTKASSDVKSDMEAPSPMDRLVCGDVGFGKTEVAVRAAFKAVMNGRQAAVLVPTTILAEQHFNTFTDRMGRYGVRIASLSRFKSTAEQRTVVHGLRSGGIDVVIGTHRLLSKDVAFKNLGLLIIDEEHRFGVTAKEKLRQLKASIDTLTLTATPIPRTLQFSLLGARDLSLINTPPRNRLPIETEIVTEDLRVIREAVIRELHRGGQVYVIHDRIHDIDLVAARLKERMPEARFRTAHGQMKAHELERVMMEFLERKFDVLVCTKIIESGIDIPSVNTIIINRADRFGLAELYQLRGRVGRSNVQAYAFLLTPPVATLSRQTLRRLQAIQEFTELGSGFNLAMRDLEIRGAGNLLGAEQSGFILEMGFELYMKIVEEAVQELREEELETHAARPALGVDEEGVAPAGAASPDRHVVPVAPVIEIDLPALIPDIYVEADAERLDLYRRMARVTSGEELSSLRDEMRDRFGEWPEEVEHLFGVVALKLVASRAGFTRVELSGTTVTFSLPPQEAGWFYEQRDGGAARFQTLMETVGRAAPPRLQLRQNGKLLQLTGSVSFPPAGSDRIAALGRLIGSLAVEPAAP